MKIKLLIIILLSLTLKAFALDNKMIQLKCESGAYPGQVKRWSYNQKDLFEFYPNGYKRVYDIKTINKKYILAEEDAEGDCITYLLTLVIMTLILLLKLL